MNGDEDFGPDRRIGFETDDEENQAERLYDGDDTDSGGTLPPSRSASVYNNIDHPTWPQSYRESMDMYTSATPPSVCFLSNSFLTSAHKRPQAGVPDDSSQLNEPFISSPTLNKDEVPTSYLPVEKLYNTSQQTRFAANELPPPQQKCSYAQSVLNAMNVLCGIGLLSVPYALKQGGWWSLVILFVLCIITCYTGILLKRCLESSPALKTYPDIGQAAFGIPGRVILAIILYIELYSSCVEYLIMMSDNLSALFPNAQINVAGFPFDSYQLCTIISTLVILPTVWLRDLSLLSYISVGGVFITLLVSLCLLWVGVVDKVGFHPSGTALDLAKLPVAIGLFSFCYGSHSVFPNIYSSMKEPSRFPSVIIISFLTSGFLYAAVAICGFLMFGQSTKSQFTLNMPTKFVASKVAAWTTVIAPVTKYAMTITPVALSVEELLPPLRFKSHCIPMLVRTILVFSTLVVALTVPYFGENLYSQTN
ncbi:transmembrane amino acid transporter family protein [Actinidia rufa]|uniref:Transmembrane amino acid transporter family protein n=1 Tax=Actinidia rufa TaxID=165716 RepID=A0A7J0GJP7_9ERIC|nr:transmembrane amino acid transporter family protein [Actinidia rufa]